ncbi:hydroxymethylglutaryl-CoA lyase [Alteromonas pelagimontana]|uniref:Hydroxymethylglutaryl-CoA lyase n=1 Tax=Alteromonas pelagimontana TaxID=1858656 RepID=A0A6M4MDA4_9ALTE|nr:hydroxymethylglutaryl-CoA lyase [Alteromonas pelagimontana]QJR81069.1 hydroxymethylglutaryl-CoA lyase [Alteromonas pelagimontana]
MTDDDNVVTIAEMSPRDGLQNEKQPVDAETKITLVDRLSRCGLRYIEAGSFVSPKWVPQMADSEKVFAGIHRFSGTTYAALTPNLKGWEHAYQASADEVAVFASASESFSQRNLNCDVFTSLKRFASVVQAAKAANKKVRAYISCALDCPFEGPIAPETVGRLTAALLAMGCYQVSLGDTIGTGTPGRVRTLLRALQSVSKSHQLALHMHDTYGQAIANIYVGLEEGIRTLDASVGGLGGCPYAKGATGNVATEDVVYLLEREGLKHGIDLDMLIQTGDWISKQLGKPYNARAGKALQSRRNNLCVP